MSDTSTQQPAQQQQQHGKQSGGSVLTHRVLFLPVWGWVVVIIGGILLYKYLKDRSAASSSTASGTVTGQNNANSIFGTEGFSVNGQGQIVDNATGAIVGTSGTGGSGGSTSTVGGWLSSMQEALQQLGYDPNLVDQALQDYSAGLPLPQNEYNVIESGIRLVGNPPSGIALPGLQSSPAPAATAPAPTTPTPVASSASGPPGLSSSIMNGLTGNGEYIVDTVYQPVTGTWLYLTQKGGVYAEGGNGFFGSLFSLPPGTFNGRTASQIIPQPNGGYTVIDTQGETYNFGPSGTGSDYANASAGNNYAGT